MLVLYCLFLLVLLFARGNLKHRGGDNPGKLISSRSVTLRAAMTLL